MKKIHYAWIVLIGLCSAQVFTNVAVYNTASLYFPYVTQDLGFSTTSMALYLTIHGLVMAAVTTVVSRKLPKINVKMMLVIGNIVLAMCAFIPSMFTKVVHWYILALFTGTAAACVQIMVPIITINNWFVKKVGLANGIFQVSNAVSTMIFSPIVSKMLANMGWASTYRIMGIIGLISPILFILPLVRFRPEDKGMTPYGFEEMAQKGANVTVYGPTEKEAVKSLAFPMTIVTVACITLLSAFMSLLTTFASAVDMLAVAGLLLTCFSGGQTVGKFLLPTLVDSLKVGATLTISCVSGIVGGVLLLVCVASPSTAMLLAAAALIGFAAGGNSLFALLIRGCYGTRDYAKLFSYHTVTQTLVGSTAISIYSFIMEKFSVGTAPVVLICAAVIGVLASVLALRSSKKNFALN